MQSNKICMGILAHVDAGKTTLSESLLYTVGALRKLGRVDHKDTFLDNNSLERERGITIFAKQAVFKLDNLMVNLLDTPGHVDFSAEMERTLQVLDYCILVISGSDGIQGHTLTLWKLLKQYEIPTFIFVNKMDQPGADKERLLEELQKTFGSSCIPFEETLEKREAFLDELAMCSEELMNSFLEKGDISQDMIAKAILHRQVFPCYFGSALHMDGVDRLLEGMNQYMRAKEYPDEFGARVYKISRDKNGNRLTHLKVTGGKLTAKMMVSSEEKIDAVRVYDGAGFQTVDSVEAGGICTVIGLTRTKAGSGLGYEKDSEAPILAPVLSYRLIPAAGIDPVKTLGCLRILEEEEPLLHVDWSEHSKEIHVRVMGEVQTEVIKALMAERFDTEVEFGDGEIVYKETVAAPVIGIGHFEPLRHYAEVHLLLRPGEPGSGITINSECSEDDLDKNWQRLIFTHLEEKTHLGVLTGSPITDLQITLLAGRAHNKHTEGGDFRQATYRAVRQGLMRAENVLLEPVFSFLLEIPSDCVGRAMSDIQRLSGKMDPPEIAGETATLTGTVPVATFREYQKELIAYTGGRGRLSCALKGYEPCHNAEEVIARIGYNPEEDIANPASSVFCAHGLGFLVGWEDVPAYAHVESGFTETGEKILYDEEAYFATLLENRAEKNSSNNTLSQTGSGRNDYITGEEIEAIFNQTYHKSEKEYTPFRYHRKNTGGVHTGVVKDGKAVNDFSEEVLTPEEREAAKKQAREAWQKAHEKQADPKEKYVLVDGYNIIFAWEDLHSLSEVNIDSARDKLMDICCDYQGYVGGTLILVYDAYKVKGNPGSVMQYNNIYVVYTKEAETADQYIEKTVHRIGRKNNVTVATSDALEQMIIWGDGATRLSAAGFRQEVENVSRQLLEEHSTDSKLGNKIVIDERILKQ